MLVAHGTVVLVLVVKDDGYRGLINAGLALFVDQFREVAGSDLGEVLDAKDETDGVEDVGFTRAVEAGDGVEVRVEAARQSLFEDGLYVLESISAVNQKKQQSHLPMHSPGNYRTMSVRFEPVNDNFFNMHNATMIWFNSLLRSHCPIMFPTLQFFCCLLWWSQRQEMVWV